MKALETRNDIELLVNKFYSKVIEDEKIGFFFNDIAKVDWERHLPIMYSFWESILFGKMSYKGNPMLVHFPINEKHSMEQQHFERWILLWKTTIEENFEGENAQLALLKAKNIAQLMSYKMQNAKKLDR